MAMWLLTHIRTYEHAYLCRKNPARWVKEKKQLSGFRRPSPKTIPSTRDWLYCSALHAPQKENADVNRQVLL